MKTKIRLFLPFLFLAFFSGCSKSNDNAAPSNPIVGLWIGTQNPDDGSATFPLYYSYDIKSDSTMLVQGEGSDGNTYYLSGTWSLNGTIFTAQLTTQNFGQAGVKQNISATYNSSLGKLSSGTIQSVGINYSATFTMDRFN